MHATYKDHKLKAMAKGRVKCICIYMEAIPMGYKGAPLNKGTTGLYHYVSFRWKCVSNIYIKNLGLRKM
jgi:hypothetical protein